MKNSTAPIALLLTALLLLPTIAFGQHVAEADLTGTEQHRAQEIRDRLRSVEVKDQAVHKIVNGTEVSPLDFQTSFPWIVSLAFSRADGSLFSFCGGSLIAPDWVLTAAHCELRVGEKAIVGRRDLTTGDGEVINIAEVFNHPDYDPRTNDSDIALLRLENPPTVPAVIALGDDTVGRPGEELTVAGWGLLEEGGSPSPVLMQVAVDVLDNTVCQVNYGGTGVQITENMVCAGRTSKDSCQGDSGGPGIVADPALGEDRQVGVVSFGIGCARPGFPGVYTRVSQFLGWIEEVSGVTPPEPPSPSDCP